MQDHPEYAGLLRDILERPADDTPRLIMADWLEDAGDVERAEFIRCQVELAVLLHDVPDRHHNSLDMILDPQDTAEQRWKHEVWELQRRERELFKAVSKTKTTVNAYEWTRPVVSRLCDPYLAKVHPTAIGAANESVLLTFRRGFVADIRLPMKLFMNHAETLGRQFPIELVEITDASPIDNTTWGRSDVMCEFRDSHHARNLPPAPHRLPRPIWDLLEGYRDRTVDAGVLDGSNNKHYSPQYARPALSAACVKYMRKLVGLPALEVPASA